MRVYQVFVDRFSTGSTARDISLALKTSRKWIGGNLRGVEKHLEYIKDLGFDAIWLSPICEAGSYHGYDVLNHFKIDPHFGKDRDLRRLVNKAHRIGLKVILDFVANHMSYRNKIFLSAKTDRRSVYRKWFRFYEGGKYDCFLDYKELPKIDLFNRDAENYVLDSAEHWVRNFDIDGYRLDHAIGPQENFWREFISECRRIKQDFVFLPEIWLTDVRDESIRTFDFFDQSEKEKLREMRIVNDDPAEKVWNTSVSVNIQRFALQKGMRVFGSILDFESNFYVRKSVAYGGDFDVEAERKGRFAFLDNHDMQRIAWLAGSKDRLLDAIRVVTSFPDITWYYGTEIGMTQQKDFSQHKGFADIEARRFMKWKFDKADSEFLSRVKSILSRN